MTLPFHPQTGDIIFTTQGSPLSYFIRLRQQDFDYSHVFIVGRQKEDGRWTGFTTGAQKLYFYGEVDLEDYLKEKTYLVQRIKGGLNEPQKTSIIGVASRLSGAPYNTVGLLKLSTLGLVTARVVHSLFKPALKFPFDALKSFFCSQAVAFIYWVGAGIQLNTRAEKADPSPYDLASIYYAEQTEDIHKNGL